MTNIDIKASILTVKDMFDDFYDVPAYQRDYVWGEEHVEQLLEDVKSAFDDNRANYFLGTTVVSQEHRGSTYDLIDGQQRLTTIFLILCAMKHFLILRNHQPYNVIVQMMHGNPSFTEDQTRIRLQPLYSESKDLMEFLATDRGAEVSKEVLNRLFDSDAQDIFANMLRAYRTITLWLNETFPQMDDFREYCTFLCSSVMFIRIQTINVKDALRLFETVNERGVRLDSVDLLKNMLFMNADKTMFQQLRNDWADLVKIVRTGGDSESIIRFIRYVVISEYLTSADSMVREHELYSWFGDNNALTGHEADPVRFLELLQTRAKQFVNLRKGKNARGEISDGVVNIGLLSSSIRQHIPMMMAAQHLESSLQQRLAQSIEHAIFVNVMTAAPARVIEQRLTGLVDKIRRSHTAADVDAVADSLYRFIVQPRESDFIGRLSVFSPARTKTNIMKYTLARLTRYMMNEDTKPLDVFLKGYDVCPIVPLDAPREMQPSERAVYSESVHCVGNFVLIEKALAKSVVSGKIPFAEAIRQSNSPYIRRFTMPVAMSERMHQIPAARWNLQAVAERNQFLVNIARTVWHV
jgi:hypothetical protein